MEDVVENVEQADSTLKSLTVGSLTLTPEFDSSVTEYVVNTTNNSNMVTAVANDENATIEISRGIASVDNGSRVTWSEGENVVTITVTNGDSVTTYTLTVTK